MSDTQSKKQSSDSTPADDSPKLSSVEGFKATSNYLRGDIPEELVDENSFFGSCSIQLLKHHGTYQQDNRDVRMANRAEGIKEKAYSMMVRTRVPGGIMTGNQLLALLDIGDELANETVRITTRQTIQFHGVLKSNLKQLIRRVNDVDLSTLAACGDVNRNVVCCPGPIKDRVHEQIQEMTQLIKNLLAPQTSSYHDIWLVDDETGEKEKVYPAEEVVEPIYGTTYLPRKFKVGIVLPYDNCIDVYSQDIGLIAVVREDEIVGYNVLVGGGMGVTPAKKSTYPAVGLRMAYADNSEVLDVVTAIVKVQRDFGNRADRKHARLKYLVNNWGLEKFKAKVEEYHGKALDPLQPEDATEHDDHIGWAEQGDGNWYYGLNVENGRVADNEDFQLKAALREVCEILNPGIHLTAHQSLLFTDIAPENKDQLVNILKRHGVQLSEDYSTARRWSIACVAWPTCGLAITESERALPGVMDQVEAEIDRLGLSEERFLIRMTGCPNGCARPYNCDVGLVGKARDRYTMYLGGNVLGNRISFIYKDLVNREEIASELGKVLEYFKRERQADETLGDFCDRKGKEDIEQWVERQSSAA